MKRSILAGLIGRDIQNSKSPWLHEQEAAALGIQLVYRLVDFEELGLGEADLAAVLDQAWQLGFNGLNVTHPFKMSILTLLDELSTDAEAIGAVNTVVFEGRRRIGHNTDWSGFSHGLQYGLPGAKLDSVAVIGAGGAGSAIAYAALSLGAKRIVIYDTDMIRAERLAIRLQAHFPDQRVLCLQSVEETVSQANGIIQATPVGMIDHPGVPFPPSLLRPDMWVVDIIFPPDETELLASARTRGCRTLNGGPMVAHQAADALALFAKVEPDSGRMLRSLRHGAVTSSRAAVELNRLA